MTFRPHGPFKQVLLSLAMLLVPLIAMAQAQGEVAYTDNFQSYGTQKNPPGWVDTSIGSSKPIANGLYKTWPDPLQASNIVFGTKQASGKPEATNNPRIGTFSTLTTKAFTGKGRFEYRGRFIRTSADTRIGFTFHSSYPEKDAYYLVGLWSQSGSADLAMQLFAFGGGAPSGTLNSQFTPQINRWYRFLIQSDDAAGATTIRARFWPDGDAEPATWSIDARDTSVNRLTNGRIGIWSAVKGDAYVDDLGAKSPVDFTPPVISFFESGVKLDETRQTSFGRDAHVEIRVNDDLSTFNVTAKLDGQPYRSLDPITTEGPHVITAEAVDAVGNRATGQVSILIDKSAPVIALLESGQPLPASPKFNRPVAIDVRVTDAFSPVTHTIKLDGATYVPLTPIATNGLHDLLVEAVDAVGNRSTAQVRFLVDQTAPVIAFFESGNPVDSNSAKFKFDPKIEIRVTDQFSTATTTALLDNQPYASGTPIPAEGRHTITVHAVDEAGNTADATLNLLVDKNAPVVKFLESGNILPLGELAKFARDAAIDINVTDAISTPTWSATLSNIAYTPLTPITNEGKYILAVHAVDEAGNVTDVTLDVLIDKSAPVIAFFHGTTQLDPRTLNKFLADFPIEIRVTDVVSGATYTATLDGQPYVSNMPITSEGRHTIAVHATDVAGNTADLELPLLLDKTRPVIAFFESGTQLDTTQRTDFAREARVEIRVTDNLPNVTWSARLDTADYTSQSPIAADGPHTVSVHAVDEAGNTSDAEVRILVDRTGPVIVFAENNVVLDTTKRNDFSHLPPIEIRVTDALLTPSFAAKLDDAPYTSLTPVPEGFHAVTVHATDNLGNGTDARLDLLVDTTPPVVTLKEGTNVLPESGAIFGRDIQAQAEVVDISKTVTVAALDGQPFSLAVPIASEGTHNLVVDVTDELNLKTRKTSSFVIDKTAPVVTIYEGLEGNRTPLAPGSSFAREVRLTASFEDITATTLTATLDGQPYQLGAPVSANGTHVIAVTGQDAASNVSAPVTITFYIDRDAPEVALLESGQPFPLNKTFARDVVATVRIAAATETTSEATIDNAPYTLGAPYPPEGHHHIKVKVTNIAGLSSTVEADFTIDKTPPVLHLNVNGAPFADNMKFAADITPVAAATDNLTAAPKIVVLLDGQPLPPGTLITDEQFHIISATATDDGELSTSVGPFHFVIDKSGPVVKVTVDDEPLVSGDQFKAPITPKITVADLTPTTITATLSGQPYTPDTEIAGDAKYSLAISVRDDLGNITTLAPIDFTIDKTPPVVSIVENGAPFTGGNFARNVKPDVTVVDLTETTIVATVDGNPWTPGQEITSEGHHRLVATVTDELGWVTVSPEIAFTIDKTAPVVKVTESGVTLVSGAIFNRDARPKITAEDTTNTTVEAKLDGAPFVSETLVTIEGKHSLTVKVTDELNQVTEIPPISFIVDKTPPAVTLTESGAPFADGALLNHDAVPHAAIVDVTDVTVVARLDGAAYVLDTPIPIEGAHALEITVTDAAGWITNVPPVHFFIDKTPPVVTVTESGAPLNTGAEFARNVRPKINVTDISATTIDAKLDGAPFISESEVSAEGSHTLTVTVTDATHWVTTLPPIVFMVDKTPPVVSITESGLPFETGTKFNRDVLPRIVITDLTATTTDAKLDGNAYTPDTAITAEGNHTLNVTVTDHLGQSTTVPPIAFTIDKTPPVVQITESGQPLASGAIFGRTIKPEIRVDDLTATTVAAVLDDQPFTFGAEIVAEGRHTLTVTVTDALGWATTVPTIEFIIDKSAPRVSIVERGTPLLSGALFNRDVVPEAIIDDLTATTTAATLDGQPYTLGTAVSPDGEHRLIVTVTDAVGLVTTTDPILFTIDKIPPSLAFVFPAANSTVATPQVSVTGNADDAVGVDVNGVEATVDTVEKKFTTPPIDLLERENLLTATGVDRAGNTGTTTITVFLDTRAPQVTITAPAADACVEGDPLQVTGTVSDAALDSVKVRLGEAAPVVATVDAATRTWSASIPRPDEGKYLLTVDATDSSGHTGTTTRTITIDRTAPTIEVRESGVPFAATLLNRRVAFAIKATDLDPAVAITATLDGQPYAAGTIVAGEGSHQLKVTATDCAGHNAETTLSFVLDFTPPSIRELVPANGSTIGNKPAAISGATDADAVRVEIAGTSIAATPASGAFTLNGVAFAEGTSRFTLRATDAAGNRSELAYSVTVRTNAPVVEILENGARIAAGTVFNRAVRPIIRTFEEGVTATATLNGQPFTSGSEITADGSYTLIATATDSLGHTGRDEATFSIDRSGPTIHITAPAAGIIATSEVEVRGTSTGAIAVAVNGNAATLNSDGTFVLASLPLDLGETIITAVARDASGNVATDQVIVTRESAGPGIVLTYPPDRSLTNRAKTEVIGRVLTPSKVAKVRIGATELTPDATGGFRLSDLALIEGENTITATAIGNDGKTTSVSTHVTADFTPPTLTINESGQLLLDGARFAERAVLTVIAADNGGAVNTTITIDGTSSPASTTVATTGGHIIHAIARDLAGNESAEERTFFIGALGGGTTQCVMSSFDPADGSVVLGTSAQLTGRVVGGVSVKVNGVVATLSDTSFLATVELPREGANTVTITCHDGDGTQNGQAATLTLIRVTGEPSITIEAPAEGFATAAESINVTGTVGPGVVDADVNGVKAVIAGTDTAVSRPYAAANVRLTSGLNQLVAHGRNAAGRVATASRRVFRLSTAPAVTISAPVNGASSGAPKIRVTGTYSNLDPATLSVTNVTVPQQPAVSAQATRWSDTTGAYTAIDVPLVPGEQTLKVSGRDRLNREASATVTVRLSDGAPSIVITEPADHSYFGPAAGDTFVVRGTFAAAAGSTVDVNGTPATITNNSYSATTGFATAGDGLTPVVARVTEPGGGSAVATLFLTKLAQGPKVTETFPAANAVQVDTGAVILVLFSAPMDSTSLAGAFRLEDASGTHLTGTLYLDKDVLTFAPATLLAPGATYRIKVSTAAKDVAGSALVAEYQSNFTTATSAPTTAPNVDALDAAVCGSALIVSGAAPSGTRLRLESGTLVLNATADATNRYSFTFPVSGQSGFLLIRVRSVGSDGSVSPAAELRVRVDCAGPQVLNATYGRTDNKLAIIFSEPIAAASATVGSGGSIVITASDGHSVAGTVTVTDATATIVPAEDLRGATFTVSVGTGIADLTGNHLSQPYAQLFAIGGEQPPAGDGSGFISGEVYDATTGRPLANAALEVEVPSSSLTASLLATNAVRTETLGLTTTTDPRGRYLVRLPEGAHTIKASLAGYTTVWRQILVPAGAGIVPIDIRLTRRGDAKAGGTALSLVHGGDTAVTRKVTLTVPAAGLEPQKRVSVTAVGAQGLAGLLPLGWSPLAAAEVAIDDALSGAINGARLTFVVPATELAAANQTLAAARYDERRDEWNVVSAAVIIEAANASVDVTTAGAYALVYPDKASGLAAPPAASSGAALRGVAAAPPDAPALTARSFALDPPIVLPSGRTVAKLDIAGTAAAKFPSGTAVQAYIDEELKLSDGSRLLDPPFATDLLLYRTPAGDAGIADFHLAPSARAAQVILEVGFDHIRILPYPGRLDRGTLIGTEGGRVPGDDKVAVDIATGAAPEPLRATVASIPQSELNGIGTIPGFQVIGGMTLSLQRATQPAPRDADNDGQPDPIAPVELFAPARATFTVDAGSLPAANAQVILAELLEQTSYGRVVRLAALMTKVDAARYATRTIDRAQLPIDGVVREGRYLLLAATSPIAYATGPLTLGGRLLPNALVNANSLGVADRSRDDGTFNVPVPATPAAPFTLVPRHTSTGAGAPYTHASSPQPEQIVRVGLNLQLQPPALTAVTVQRAGTSESIALSTTTTAGEISPATGVRAAFSTELDSASVTASSIVVTDTATGAIVKGSAVADGATGINWTLTPGQRLANDTIYNVTISGSLKARNGSVLGRNATFSFRTAAELRNSEIHPEKIRITIPDANGVSRVSGTAGALPAGWNAVAVRRGFDFVTRPQAVAANDGSFAFNAGDSGGTDRVSLTDVIDLQIVNNAGNLAGIIPLTPFVTADGRGFVVPPNTAVRYTTTDGILIDVPAGAFDKSTLVTATTVTRDAFAGIPSFDSELNYVASIRLDFDGMAKERINVELPVPSGIDTNNRTFLLAWRGESSRGPRLMVADTLRVANGRFTTFEDPSANATSPLRISALSTAAGLPTETNRTLVGKDVKKYLMGCVLSGMYLFMDIRVPTQTTLAWAAMDSFQSGYELFWSAFASLYTPAIYMVERGRVVIPVLTTKPFTVVGVDASTGLTRFSRAYDPIPIDQVGAGVTIDNPEINAGGPYPIFGTPFRVEIIDVGAGDVEIDAVRNFTVKLANGHAKISAGKKPLPSETHIEAMNVTQGDFVSGTSGAGLTIDARRGDRLVLLIGEKEIDPETSMSVVFNEPIYVEGDNDDQIEEFLRNLIKLERITDSEDPKLPGFSTDITKQVSLTLDSGGRRLTIGTPTSLLRGATYTLTLRGDIADRKSHDGQPTRGFRLGAGSELRNNVSTEIGGGASLRLEFKVRKPGGNIASFDIRQSAERADGAVRDLALTGNVLLVTALDGGVLAYDASDPAALDGRNGKEVLPFAFVRGREEDGPGVTWNYWAVAPDTHNRVFVTGMTPVTGFIRSYRVEDFVKAKDASSSDCGAFSPHAVCKATSSALVSWTLGYSSTLGLASNTFLSDRPESIPRKLQVLVQDDDEAYDGLAEFKEKGHATEVKTFANGMKQLSLTLARDASIPYLYQRITVENATLDLKWSADATPTGDAKFTEILAGPTDRIIVKRNRATYGVLSHYGFGIGVYDLNAIESNDYPDKPSNYKTIREQIALTSAAIDPECFVPYTERTKPPDYAIPDLSLSAEAGVTIGADGDINVYAPDPLRGILDLRFPLPTEEQPLLTEEQKCDIRSPEGLLFNTPFGSEEGIAPRIKKLHEAVESASSRPVISRYNSVATYHWSIEPADNARGLRGSMKNRLAWRDYLLVAGGDYGVLVVETDGSPTHSGPHRPLTAVHLVDVIWIPGGAVAVRTIPRSNYATVVDRRGRVLLVDISHIDERFDDEGNPRPGDELFPTAKKAINGTAIDPTDIGADDPRIIWKSDPGIVSGTLAPVIDPDTGMLYAGELMKKAVKVVAGLDPQIRMKVDIGEEQGLSVVTGVVPLGLEPPKDIKERIEKLPKCEDGKTARCRENASLAAFRLEVALPGSIAEALTASNKELRVAVESERVLDAVTEQTPEGFPRAHLRRTLRDGSEELPKRAAKEFKLERILPDDATLAKNLRFQKGYNKFLSPWIIAIADPRASAQYHWDDPTADHKEDLGCRFCDRPTYLKDKREDDGVYELWTNGRIIAVRPELIPGQEDVTIFNNTPYEYLGKENRFVTRFATIMADTVRPVDVLVAAQNPPVATGAIEGTLFVHSGELMTGAVDLVAGGRAGIEVVADRTYRSRVLGSTPLGQGWTSSIFRRIRALPSGDVEYRDSSGETWLFKPKDEGGTAGTSSGEYEAAKGLDLKLARDGNGWRLIDQQRRITVFDELGRLVSESDEFVSYDSTKLAAGLMNGNVLRYLYDESGRLAKIIDPVDRTTELTYWESEDANEQGAYVGLLKEVKDWRDRSVVYRYDDYGRLESVDGVETEAAQGVPAELSHTGSKRPRIDYTYNTIQPPAEDAPNDPKFNDYIELSNNLELITEPDAVASGGRPRMDFDYGESGTPRDRMIRQFSVNFESVTVTYTEDKTVTKDILGQEREYTFTGKPKDDERVQIASLLEKQVPVIDTEQAKAPLQPNRAKEDLLTTFTYDDDQRLKTATYPSGHEVKKTWTKAAGGAPGSVLQTRIETGAKLGTETSTIEYDSDSNHPTASATPVAVSRTTSKRQGTIKIDTQVPNRERDVVESRDDKVTYRTKHDTDGQVKETAVTDGNNPTRKTTISYNDADDPTELIRSRPKEIDSGDARKLKITYEAMSFGGERVITVDEVRRTRDESEYDGRGRLIHQVMKDRNGDTLSDESYGYDVNGRLAFRSRAQKGVGTVLTHIGYDEMGRQNEVSTTGNDVGGAPVTLKSETRYDLIGHTIQRFAPSTSTSPIVETTTLDNLGRPEQIVRKGGVESERMVQLRAYDKTGQLAYESDGANAVLRQHAENGLEVATIGTDGIKTTQSWDQWGRPLEQTLLDSSGHEVTKTERAFSPLGRPTLVTEQIGSASWRRTQFNWDSGDRNRTTAVFSINEAGQPDETPRGTQQTLDEFGRVREMRTGVPGLSGDILGIDILQLRQYDYDGMLAKKVTTSEPKGGGGSSFTELEYDGAGHLLSSRVQGGEVSTFTYDEAGNVLTDDAPGYAQASAKYDSRGLMTSRTLPDGKVRTFKYDELGNLRELHDESGETTKYVTDSVGRIVRTEYPDGTTEETKFEDGGTRVAARKDRADHWHSYTYDDGGRISRVRDGLGTSGPVVIKYVYDEAGRLIRASNPDAGIEYGDYDGLGRPGTTYAYRYASGSGVSDSPVVLDVHAQSHKWSAYDERTRWTLPVAGRSIPETDATIRPWLLTIFEERDEGANLMRQSGGGSRTLVEATRRSLGKISARTRGPVVTDYGYFDGLAPSSGIELPAGTSAQSMLPRWASSTVGTTRVGGAAVARDAADRVSAARDLGLGARSSQWSYDGRGRLASSWLDASGAKPSSSPITDRFIDADFRAGRTVPSTLSEAERAQLGPAAAFVEPLSWTATKKAAQQLDKRTAVMGGATQKLFTYAFQAGRRTSDGTWVSTFDEFGRLASATNSTAQRRLEYTWDPNDRLVGRRALMFDSAQNKWIPEIRNDVLAKDGLPADVTMVWDPVADRLVAIYEAGRSTASDSTPNIGLLRQYVHGDQADDDPVRVLVKNALIGVVEYVPIVDEAGTGSLQSIVDADTGNILERVLYADSFGDAPRYLRGAVLDKMTFQATRAADGEVGEVKVSLHFTEQITTASLEHGLRLAAFDKSGQLVATSNVAPKLEQGYTAVWTLDRAEWNALAKAPEAKTLEIAVSQDLRAAVWGNIPPSPAPDWAVRLYGVSSSEPWPVAKRQPFAELNELIASIEPGKSRSTDLYAIPNVYAAASEDSLADLFFDFQALPFRDPATGLVYARARWYDSATGTFLTADPLGAVDSTNLYAFAAGDPVNGRDPNGLSSVRQWLGFEDDIDDGHLIKGYSKVWFYSFYNVLTASFVERHDVIYEDYLRTDDVRTYRIGAAKELGRAAVYLEINYATAGWGSGLAPTLTGTILRGAAGGAASNLVSTFSVHLYDGLTGGPGADFSDYLSSALMGAAWGGVSNWGLWKAADASDALLPRFIYRGATRGNLGHLEPRGHKTVSFRDSMTNAWPKDVWGEPVLKENWIEVWTTLLPRHSVILDGGTDGLPPGHASVLPELASPEQIDRAITRSGKFPKQPKPKK